MKIVKFFKQNIFLIILFGVIFINLAVGLRINVFRYNNFDFGKFDLGNMTQMVWNTLHGRLLYLTDYFGANMPRWAMSHVDPILLLFVPIFAVFQHPLTLVFSQMILIVFSSLIIYKIALLELDSKFAAATLGTAFLFYPAIGYINSQTGFHGVSAVIPFFLGAFYIFELMYKSQIFTKRNIIIFWILLVLTMSGKEQLALYVLMYGLFILLCRPGEKTKKIAISMMGVSLVWFVLAFFVIIPRFAHHRVAGYEEFSRSIGVEVDPKRDIALPNYFLSRYDAFGDSYLGVIVNVLLDHRMAIRVIFGGERPENLQRTFTPVLFLPLLHPGTFMMAVPDMAINYLTSAGGIGTAEIENHRISMIIPVLFISTIFAISFISKNLKKIGDWVKVILPTAVLISCVVTAFKYNSPIYLWLEQAVRKRVGAAYEEDPLREDLKVGDVVKIADLDNKDVLCSQKMVNMIPDEASVSGPDYLGAHLSMRETYAIFPALWNSADYVIVDVFLRKILTILDLDTNIVRDVVEDLIKSDIYKLTTGCGNLFLFEKVDSYNKEKLLSLQERYFYPEKYDYKIYSDLNVVDFSVPSEITRGIPSKARVVYAKRTNDSLDGYVLYMIYINAETGEMYQAANLPSFAITRPEAWTKNRYYIEDIDIAFPKYLDPGVYRAFISMSNKVKIRSVYLSDIKVN